MALALNDRLARNENNLAGKIYQTTINRSVWNKLIPKEEWTDGLSDVQRVLTVERNLPDNIDDWNDVDVNSNSNSCAPTADIVPRGNTERTYQLTQKAQESDRICVNDTRNAYMVNDQIAKVFTNLRNVVSYTWKRRGMLEYTRIAEHKVVAANGLPFNDSDFPGIAATSMLTQRILNIYYQYLIQNSAELDGGSLGMQDGRPQFILVTDAETSDAIMREDATNNAFLWNGKRVPELLSPLGVDRGFRGFYHTIDNLPRRYTFAGGVYTEVLPYIEVAASTGVKQKLNPDYMAAPYQDSVIFLPSVMAFKHPKPISSVGSGTSFQPQTYVGDFKWLNVQNVDSASSYYNPDNAWGFYRALLMSATKPIHPEFGIVIRHLRCPSDIGAQACPESTAGDESDLGSGDSFFV
jgi:hypothetical protein